MSKNKFKVNKPDVNGNELSETIGKGINEIHKNKALSARTQNVGIMLTRTRKEQFKRACIVLDITQNDALDLAISETIKKAML